MTQKKEEALANELDSLGIGLESEKKDDAFKNAQGLMNAIPVDEFEKVLSVLQDSYDSALRFIKSRNKAINATKEKLKKVKEMGESLGISPDKISKDIKKLKHTLYMADKEAMESVELHFESLSSTVSFLNKFKTSEDLLEMPNIDFYYKLLKKQKK